MIKSLKIFLILLLIASQAQAGTTLRRVKLMDADNNLVDVQYPLSVDGADAHEKDINVAASSSGTFTGNVVDLVNSYTDSLKLVDSSATNPKTFTIHFERPITTNSLGLASPTGSNFSNVRIELQSSTGNIRNQVDDSGNNAKRTDHLYQFTKTTFIKAVVEFHTADPVGLNASKIDKIQSRSISAIDGYVSETNSTDTPLTSGSSFTGGQVDTLNYGMVMVAVHSDVASATDGLEIQFRSTATGTWRTTDSYTIPAATDKTYSIQAVRRFMRVIYTNGLTAQSTFDLQTVLKPVYVKPSSHRVKDAVSGEDDAELVININKAEDPSGTSVSIGATESHNLKVANAEDALNIAQGNVVGQSTVHKFGRGADIDTADGFVVLWDGAEYNVALKTYTYSTSADIDRISSDNASDTEPIEILGLDTNWDLVTQTKTLTGQTPVALDTPLIRVFRMKNVGTSDIAGNVFCFVNVTTTLGVPDTITNTRAMINNGNNQTLMALYTIPAGKTGYIISWYAALSSAKASSLNNMEMKARPFGGVFQLKHTSTLSSTGSSHVQHTYFVPQSFPAKTDFVMLSDSSVNDNAVSAGFDLVLIDD